MSTIAREPARAAPERRHWSAQILVREMWASLAIAAMWLAVLFAAVFAPDFVSSDAGGNTTRIPRRSPSHCSPRSAPGRSRSTVSAARRMTMTDRSVGVATRYPGEAPPLCGPDGGVVSGSIAEVAYLRSAGSISG